MKLKGQTIVLTGASSGIGAEAAKIMARRGATVCLVARREEQLREVQELIEADGGCAFIYPCDLSDNVAIDACAARILAEQPRIDALVNNAAHSIRRPIEQSLDRLHDYQRTVQLNYIGAVAMTLKLLPRFLEQGHGHVVNISSLSTQVPIPLFSAYLASKSALESFTRSLAGGNGPPGHQHHGGVLPHGAHAHVIAHRHLQIHADDAREKGRRLDCGSLRKTPGPHRPPHGQTGQRTARRPPRPGHKIAAAIVQRHGQTAGQPA
ncbi:SDR family NAD(P)-dependent oxidoreductase [Alcanivorax sp. IL3]|uniref:SDR family NAD(P)-dependent oxidoreductase n=1 Tax=Alcanivorax sp. IL3 TaxID=3396309 RepID=UPI0039C44108